MSTISDSFKPFTPTDNSLIISITRSHSFISSVLKTDNLRNFWHSHREWFLSCKGRMILFAKSLGMTWGQNMKLLCKMSFMCCLKEALVLSVIGLPQENLATCHTERVCTLPCTSRIVACHTKIAFSIAPHKAMSIATQKGSFSCHIKCPYLLPHKNGIISVTQIGLVPSKQKGFVYCHTKGSCSSQKGLVHWHTKGPCPLTHKRALSNDTKRALSTTTQTSLVHYHTKRAFSTTTQTGLIHWHTKGPCPLPHKRALFADTQKWPCLLVHRKV